MIEYENYKIATNIILAESFGKFKTIHNDSSQRTTTTRRNDRMFKPFIFCPNGSCINTFESEEDLENHISLNQHTTKDSCLRSKDRVKLMLFDKLRNDQTSSLSLRPVSVTTASTYIPRHYKLFEKEGWALRVRKPSKRIDDNVKVYIKLIFEEEQMYGKEYQSILLLQIHYVIFALQHFKRTKNTNRRICETDSHCS